MIHPTVLADLFNAALPLRNAALTSLSGLDADDAAAFVERSRGAPVERRLRVVQRLLELGEDDATLDFSALFVRLLADASAEVRRAAIEGLWEYEQRELIAPLVGLMTGDPDPSVRAAAALSLGRYVVLNEFEAIRPSDAEAVLTALRETAGDAAQPPEVRARALESVGASSEPWVETLIWRAYDADERRVQLSALHAMGRNGEPKWLPTLYDELESEDSEHRFEAAGAAGQIGDEDAVPRLADLIGDPDPEVQEAAMLALGQIGGDLALEVLRSHLNDADERVAEAARAAVAEAEPGSALLGGVGNIPGADLPGDEDEG